MSYTWRHCPCIWFEMVSVPSFSHKGCRVVCVSIQLRWDTRVLFVTNVTSISIWNSFFVALNTVECFTCSMGVQCPHEIAVNDKRHELFLNWSRALQKKWPTVSLTRLVCNFAEQPCHWYPKNQETNSALQCHKGWAGRVVWGGEWGWWKTKAPPAVRPLQWLWKDRVLPCGEELAGLWVLCTSFFILWSV